MQPSVHIFLKEQLAEIISGNVASGVMSWLQEKSAIIAAEDSAEQLHLTFVTVPRKTGRQAASIDERQTKRLQEIHPLYNLNDWTLDRMCRVWLLLHVDPVDKERYCRKIESLFNAAEMNELVALYSGFPGFAYPEYWQQQCAEGIRNNIDGVLKAIMYNNPYPFNYLPEPAWNQLVLKAFFTEKDIHRVIGIDERANPELASILLDYANERWSAHRVVNPQLWRLVAPFIDATNFENIERAFRSKDLGEKKAAALACYHSKYDPAHQLLEEEPVLKISILENKLDWRSL